MSRINSIQFNQDNSCFIVAHTRGFNVYSSDPVDQLIHRDFGAETGLIIASILERSNYMALVGSGTSFVANQVMLWNDQTQSTSTIDFEENIINALVSRSFVVAITKQKVHIAAIAIPHSKWGSIDTDSNPNGVAALHDHTLVVPARKRGQIAIIDCEKAQTTRVVPCHQSSIAAIAISSRYIATASATGTLIRVQNRQSNKEIWLRRGLDKAQVYSIAFSPNSTHLAVLSDKQTLHVFDLTNSNVNERHAMADLPFTPNKYFHDEWSQARVKTRSKQPGICGWISENAILVLRPAQAQWEKYILQSSGIVLEGWKAIR